MIVPNEFIIHKYLLYQIRKFFCTISFCLFFYSFTSIKDNSKTKDWNKNNISFLMHCVWKIISHSIISDKQIHFKKSKWNFSDQQTISNKNSTKNFIKDQIDINFLFEIDVDMLFECWIGYIDI